MHAELLVAGERIVQLRAGLDKKSVDAKEAMSEVCMLGEELARARDSMDGPNRILHQHICRLKGKIHMQQVLGYSDDADGSSVSDDGTNKSDDMCGDGIDADCIGSEVEAEDNNINEPSITRKRPQIDSYKKKGGVVAAEYADARYKTRKLAEFESVADALFGGTLSSLGPLADVSDDTPRTITSKERGIDAFKWVLKRFMMKHPTLWTYLLREMRTVQEAKETTVA
jgi:hypothetical protein